MGCITLSADVMVMMSQLSPHLNRKADDYKGRKPPFLPLGHLNGCDAVQPLFRDHHTPVTEISKMFAFGMRLTLAFT